MAENIKNIQWFPGHMAKTRRKIQEDLKLVDAVVEILDARTPFSSSNPEIPSLVGNKPRIILLCKSDLADNEVTEQFVKYYNQNGVSALPVDCKSGEGIKQFFALANETLAQKVEKNRAKGINKALRFMVVGIPNVGKSSFINKLADKKAKVENRPGVTRGNQWFAAANNILFLDTPGVLWPKFQDEKVGERLAITGAIKDPVLDIEEIAVKLIEYLQNNYPMLLPTRYGVDVSGVTPYDALILIGKKRGMLIRGGETDTERTAKMITDEFRNGKIGKISLERPE